MAESRIDFIVEDGMTKKRTPPKDKAAQARGAGEFQIYLPRVRDIASTTIGTRRPLHVQLDTNERPNLRRDLDRFLQEELDGMDMSDYMRWLISYAIAQVLKPPGF